MIRRLSCFAFALALSTPLFAQQGAYNLTGRSAATIPALSAPMPAFRPFSRLAFEGGVGLMGVNLQAATDLGRYANVRAIGNVFSYTVNNISTNGFNASGNLNFASIGASLDFYPFPYHGFRLSPGLLFYNQNDVSLNATVAAGQSFKLNGTEYYSSASDPITAAAKLGLNATNPAFTATTGWGNMISRTGGHWAFPVEVGAAFVGSPALSMTLAGTACDSNGQNCFDAATNSGLQTNLQAQIAKYNSDLNPLKVYPIITFGVSYSFRMQSH
jgi:hypothetical protein